VLEALGSTAANKYASGYPGKRHYPGCEIADEIEQLAIDRAKTLFGAEHANVQPYAGTTANEAVISPASSPATTILSLPFAQGGHPTHGDESNLSGKLYNTVSYGVRRDNFLIDYDQVRTLALEHRPRLIICGGSAYPRIVEVERFREIADEVGALLMCDMAHFAGLVAAGLHPNPVPTAISLRRPRTRRWPGPAEASFSAGPSMPGRWTRPSSPSSRAGRCWTRSRPRRRASRLPARRRLPATSAACARTPIGSPLSWPDETSTSSAAVPTPTCCS